MNNFFQLLAQLFNPSPKQTNQSLGSPLPSQQAKAMERAANNPDQNTQWEGTPYQSLISQAAKQYNIDPSFLAGALSRESGQFADQYVHGYHMDGTGRGIAGIDKTYHPEVSDQQAFDPNFAIPWMAQQLSQLQQKDGSLYDAYREYNGGPNYNSNSYGFGGNSVAWNTAHNADAVNQLANQYKPFFSNY